MNHQEYHDRLSALLDGELEEEKRLKLLAHLEGCGDCRSYFAQLNELRLALGDLAPEEPPEDFAAGVMARVREEKGTPRRGRSRRTWTALAACAAAAALAVAALPRMGVFGGAAPAAQHALTTSAAAESAPAETEEAAADIACSAEAVPADTAPAAMEPGSTESAGNAAALPKNAPDESLLMGQEVPATEKMTDAGAAAGGTAATGALPGEEALSWEGPPTATLTGEGAEDWLLGKGWQGESGDWYAEAEDLLALPEGLLLRDGPDADYRGPVRIELGREAAP